MNNEEEDNIQKMPPYQRLQNIFSEDEDPVLTDKAKNTLRDLLGDSDEEHKPSIWEKIKSFFKKIDNKIFTKGSKISSRYQRR
jgi:hypothetical protein